MSSLTLYRELVPGHGAVDDSTVETWLDLAAQRHTASKWGDVYGSAMVMWAAAHLEVMVQRGEVGRPGAPCAPPPPPPGAAKPAAGVESTPYWHWYLDYRRSRAATAPMRVSTCP